MPKTRDQVTQMFIRWMKRRGERGDQIPAALRTALDELTAPDVEPVSPEKWDAALAVFVEEIKKIPESSYQYNYGLQSTAVSAPQFDEAVARVLTKGHPKAPLDELKKEIRNLNGYSQDRMWISNKAYQIAMKRVTQNRTISGQ